MSLVNILEDGLLGDEEECDENDSVADDSQQMANVDFMENLLKERKIQPSKFESYWEKDENDIGGWTSVSL